MDWRKFMWAVLAMAAGVAILLAYMDRKSSSAPADKPGGPAASQPASAPAASQPETPSARQTSSAPISRQTSTTTALEAQTQPSWYGPTVQPEEKVVIGSFADGGGYPFQVELVNEGAAINTVKLTEYFATVSDKRLHDRDPKAYLEACEKDPRKHRGHYSLLNPVSHGGRTHLPLATRRVRVQVEGRQGIPPVDVDSLDRQIWHVEERSAERASFSYTLFLGRDLGEARNNPVLKLVKTYAVSKGDFSIAVSLRLENLSRDRLKVLVDQAGPTGVPREDLRSDCRQAAYGYFLPEDKRVQAVVKSSAELAKWNPDEFHYLGSSVDRTPMLWAGQVNKFFGSMMYVKPDGDKDLDAPALKARFYVAAAVEASGTRTFLTGLEVPEIDLAAGESRQADLDVFAGPKKREMFTDKSAPHYRALYQRLNYIGTIDFGSCFCAFSWLTLAMMWLLEAFSRIAFGNYGVAIILLVLLVRLALHPLTKKGQVSMSRMQKLGPQIQQLKEKHAGDKETLNREMMRAYKEQGASPLIGCLPMVLQMPIWIALWTAMNSAVELRHAPLLPVWITDLAAPDALLGPWDPPVSVPVLSMLFGPIHSFNLLPILLTVAMFFQSKMTPQASQAATPEQVSQQKMMKYMMPAMMLLFFYAAPSGLTLYIMASTFAGVVEQTVIKRHIEAREAAEAAAETKVEAPGKGPRATRPKKLKGPFWVKRG